eukprot:gene3371-5918_t
METPLVNVTPPPYQFTPSPSPQYEEESQLRLRKKLFESPPPLKNLNKVMESPLTANSYNQNGSSPTSRSAEEGSKLLGVFQAVKLYKNEFHYAYEKPTITVDARPHKKCIILKLNNYKDQSLSKQLKQIIDPGFRTPRMNVRETLTISFDEISGLDFQYAPCEDVIIAIELFRKKKHDNPLLCTDMFFLQCKKQDSATYFDEIVLKSDKRLLKLSIKQLPSWCTFVNRYRIPIYYSYYVRLFVTFFVNVYIIISLFWGFYDLYKHLPFVGDAIRKVFGPIIEPLLENRIVLLFPLIFNRIGLVFGKLFEIRFPLISQAWGILLDYCSLIGSYFDPIINLFWTISQPISMIFNHLKNLFSYVLTIPLNFFQILFNFLLNIKNLITWLFYGPLEAISVVFSTLFELIKLIYYAVIYPLMKIKDFISPAQDVVQAGANVASRTEELRKVWSELQITIAPLQRVWFGIKRISDSVYHTYLTRIKPTPKKQRYLLSVCMGLGLFIALVWILVKIFG